MSSKRRTFHVDWDSPSTETGTVKRRPTSMSETFSASENCFENVEYYEVRNFIGGFDLRLLDTSDERLMLETEVGSTGKPLQDGESKKSERKIRDNGSSSAVVSSIDKSVRKLSIKSKTGENKKRRSLHIQDRKDAVELRTERQPWKFADRKEFGLKLCKDPVSWKSAKSTKNSSAWRNSPSSPGETSEKAFKQSQRKSAIPKPKLTRSASSKSGRGLVNSSSESSGIGSPLSPLSPLQQRDTTACSDDPAKPGRTEDVSDRVIRSSDSKSSGLGSPGSPDSPLSPDSQQYAAFYLIQQQLEKLHNCPCERRQAQVHLPTFFYWLSFRGSSKGIPHYLGHFFGPAKFGDPFNFKRGNQVKFKKKDFPKFDFTVSYLIFFF